MEPHPLPVYRGSGSATMSSHPQSVPTTRRTVETRHLPNPATLPLQLQRAHTVRRPAQLPSVRFPFRWNPRSAFVGFLALGAWWIFGKQGITLNPRRAWTQGPHWSFSDTHSQVVVLCTQSCSLIRCLSWKFMLSLYGPMKVSPIISTIVCIAWTKLSVFQRGGHWLMWRFVQWPRVFATLFVPVWQQR